MNAFELGRPGSVPDAVGLLNGPAGQTLPLGGGQDILALMKDGVFAPERLVSLRGIDGLRAIDAGRDGLRLGALVTLSELAAHRAVRERWPVLAQAAGEAATPQIRNVGTVGGNLAQRPRCWYYRAAELVCLRKGGPACLAVDGDNRYHAILGNEPCRNPHMASLSIPLLALGATAHVTGAGGERAVPLTALYDLFEGDVASDTALAPDEIITGVSVPAADGWSTAHEEVRFKDSHDWPAAMATVALALDGGAVRDARIVLGAVAPTPYVAARAAEALVGKRVTPELAGQAAEAELAAAEPLSQNAYKIPLTRNLLRRTIVKAAGLGDR